MYRFIINRYGQSENQNAVIKTKFNTHEKTNYPCDHLYFFFLITN
jgi:hypothetical protein